LKTYRNRLAARGAALFVSLALAPQLAIAALPLVFESVTSGDGANFVASGPDYRLVVSPTGTQLQLHSAAGGDPAVVRSTLLGADASAKMQGLDAVPGGTSHFVGNDPANWRRAVPTFHRVLTRAVYPGIDLLWHGHDGTLEYDFVVAPGNDPASIVLAFDGATDAKIDDAGNLILTTAAAPLRWRKPVSYQELDGRRVAVSSGYRIAGDGRIGFEVGAYDRTRPLVIDPVLAYATYAAATTFAAGDGTQNYGLAIVADADGNAYVAGLTESASYPATGGAYDTTRPGKTDVFVAKLAPDGKSLLWATYLGGSQAESDNFRSLDIAIDADANVYLTGSTKSADFPTSPGAYDTTLAGTTDVFVTKLAADGASLVWSTYLGGTSIERGWGIAVDADGFVYVGGETSGLFPTTAGAYQTASDNLSAFATKFAVDGSSLVWSTTIGVSTGAARDLALDKQNNVYLTGVAAAPQNLTVYPVTEGAYQTEAKGNQDAFVTKIEADGSELVYSTYLGGTFLDDGRAIAVDSAGRAYVAGNTNSTDFPTTPDAFQKTNMSSPQNDAFVARLNASGTALDFSTMLGGASLEDATDIVVDGAGNALVSGNTLSTGFPTTDGALQEDFGPNAAFLFGSAWLSKISTSGGLSYSTLFHPTTQAVPTTSVGYALALDGNGAAYLTGSSGTGLPTTADAFQTSIYSVAAAGPFVAKIDEVASPSTTAPLCGDFNGDGKLTAGDALGTLKAAVGNGTCALTVCDFNGDGNLSASDALGTLRVAVGQSVTAKCPSA